MVLMFELKFMLGLVVELCISLARGHVLPASLTQQEIEYILYRGLFDISFSIQVKKRTTYNTILSFLSLQEEKSKVG